MAQKPLTAIEEREAFLTANKAKMLIRPNELAETISLPAGLAAALATGRVELIRLQPAPTSIAPEEIAALYHAIGVLIETNMLLQQHARTLEQMTDSLYSQAKGIVSGMVRVSNFAAFKTSDDDDSE